MNEQNRFIGGALTRRLASALFLLALPAPVWAGQVRGKVVDPAGAVLPGVTVTLANDLTGFSEQTASAADGSFIFYNVPSNPYHLRASLKGFGVPRRRRRPRQR